MPTERRISTKPNTTFLRTSALWFESCSHKAVDTYHNIERTSSLKLPSFDNYFSLCSVILRTAYKRGGYSSLIILQRMSLMCCNSVLIATSASNSSAALLLKVQCYQGTLGEYVCNTALITFSRTVIGGVVTLTASSIYYTSGQYPSSCANSNFYLTNVIKTSKALAAKLFFPVQACY